MNSQTFAGDSSNDDDDIQKTGIPNVIMVQEYQPGITDGVSNQDLVEKDQLRGIRAMKRKEARMVLPSDGKRRF